MYSVLSVASASCDSSISVGISYASNCAICSICLLRSLDSFMPMLRLVCIIFSDIIVICSFMFLWFTQSCSSSFFRVSMFTLSLPLSSPVIALRPSRRLCRSSICMRIILRWAAFLRLYATNVVIISIRTKLPVMSAMRISDTLELKMIHLVALALNGSIFNTPMSEPKYTFPSSTKEAFGLNRMSVKSSFVNTAWPLFIKYCCMPCSGMV